MLSLAIFALIGLAAAFGLPAGPQGDRAPAQESMEAPLRA
jgi:type II secretory pathway component PulJ